MKKLTTILVTIALGAIATCSGNISYAQVSASAQATATIVTPLTIEKMADLQFEQVINKASQKSATHRTARKSNAAGSHAATTTSSIKPASFNVSGYPGYTYGVTVPASVTITNGAQEFTLNNIVASASFNQILSAKGKGTVSITGTPSFRAADVPAADAMIALSDPDEPQGLPVTIIYN
jgi:hypothetical protein